MIKKTIKYLYILTFFIITSCYNDINQNIIEKEKMVEILIEMHLMEESIDILELNADTSKALFLIKEQEIFDSYSVTEKEYRESFSYYFFNSNDLDNIYGNIIDSLMLYQQLK